MSHINIHSNGIRTLIAQACFGLGYSVVVKYTKLSSVLSSFPTKWQAIAFGVSAIVQALVSQEEEAKPLNQKEKVFKYLSPFVLLGATACYIKSSHKAGLLAVGILSSGQLLMSNGAIKKER